MFRAINMAPALHTHLPSKSLFLFLMSSTCLTWTTKYFVPGVILTSKSLASLAALERQMSNIPLLGSLREAEMTQVLAVELLLACCAMRLGIAHTGTEGRVGAKADGSRLGPQPEYDDSFTLVCSLKV